MTKVLTTQEQLNKEYREVRALFDPKDVLTDEQISIFLQVAKERKLDPRLSQICLVPRWSSVTQRNEAVHIVRIDGLRLIADRTKRYAPGKDTEYYYDNNGRLASARVYVSKQTDDGTWHQFSETASMSEYSTGKNLWKTMPHVMLAKCAEARALRRAFPGETSGLYVQEEMDQALEDVIKDDKSENDPLKLTNAQTEYLEDLMLGARGTCGVKIEESLENNGYTTKRMPKDIYELAVKYLEERQEVLEIAQ